MLHKKNKYFSPKFTAPPFSQTPYLLPRDSWASDSSVARCYLTERTLPRTTLRKITNTAFLGSRRQHSKYSYLQRQMTNFSLKRNIMIRQHCRLSICEYWLSWTNTVSEQKIPITILILKRGPCLGISG